MHITHMHTHTHTHTHAHKITNTNTYIYAHKPHTTHTHANMFTRTQNALMQNIKYGILIDHKHPSFVGNKQRGWYTRHALFHTSVHIQANKKHA